MSLTDERLTDEITESWAKGGIETRGRGVLDRRSKDRDRKNIGVG
jgi:hypothetical protein